MTITKRYIIEVPDDDEETLTGVVEVEPGHHGVLIEVKEYRSLRDEPIVFRLATEAAIELAAALRVCAGHPEPCDLAAVGEVA